MRHAVSISLGSSRRDKSTTIRLLGQELRIERIGTNGDEDRARDLFEELDGKVDAFGMGGIDLSVGTLGRSYPLAAARRLIQGVRHTPVVDGRGLKHTLERRAAAHIERQLGDVLQPKHALVNVALDRHGMALGLQEAGYTLICGDLMFALGLPLPLKSLRAVDRMARLMGPIVGRLAPISALYPTGEKQHETVPRFERWYAWATLIAGDCCYTKRHMPASLAGKSILTNTTTEADVERFRAAGVRYLITTTPRIEDRSFGTNMMEAALVALAGKGRCLTPQELMELIKALDMAPEITLLNG